MFLYILISANGKFYKIGIAETHQRIFNLYNVYPLLLEYSFAIELPSTGIIRSIEGYLLKLTEKDLCKSFVVREDYSGKTFPGQTELRNTCSLFDTCKALLSFIEIHKDEMKFVQFSHYECPECEAEHKKYKYVSMEDIVFIRQTQEIIKEDNLLLNNGIEKGLN